MKKQHITIELDKNPTVQDIFDLFPEKQLGIQRTIIYGSRLIKAERKTVFRFNQIKSNLLHVYTFDQRLNAWTHLVENKEGGLKTKDYEAPSF